MKSLSINKRDEICLKFQERTYECRGGTEGAYLVYLPSEFILSQKIIFLACKVTLVPAATMATTKLCSPYWIAILTNLVKIMIRN